MWYGYVSLGELSLYFALGPWYIYVNYSVVLVLEQSTLSLYPANSDVCIIQLPPSRNYIMKLACLDYAGGQDVTLLHSGDVLILYSNIVLLTLTLNSFPPDLYARSRSCFHVRVGVWGV